MKLRMLRNRVMLRPAPVPEKIGVVHLPQDIDEEHRWSLATVLGVGPLCKDVEVGQVVLFDRDAPGWAVPGSDGDHVIGEPDVKGVVLRPGQMEADGRFKSVRLWPIGERVFYTVVEETEALGFVLPAGVRYCPHRIGKITAVHWKSKLAVGDCVIVDERLSVKMNVAGFGEFWAMREEYTKAVVNYEA